MNLAPPNTGSPKPLNLNIDEPSLRVVRYRVAPARCSGMPSNAARSSYLASRLCRLACYWHTGAVAELAA
jgi:hypothetical protein